MTDCTNFRPARKDNAPFGVDLPVYETLADVPQGITRVVIWQGYDHITPHSFRERGDDGQWREIGSVTTGTQWSHDTWPPEGWVAQARVITFP